MLRTAIANSCSSGKKKRWNERTYASEHTHQTRTFCEVVKNKIEGTAFETPEKKCAGCQSTAGRRPTCYEKKHHKLSRRRQANNEGLTHRAVHQLDLSGQDRPADLYRMIQLLQWGVSRTVRIIQCMFAWVGSVQYASCTTHYIGRLGST